MGGALSLSTMAAAGCGNMVSDVLGIGISGQIEVRRAARLLLSGRFTLTRQCVAPLAQRTCDAMGFRSRLTAAQMQLPITQSPFA